MERATFHIVGGDSRARAEQSRTIFALGHHAEVYSDIGEFVQRPVDDGIVLAAEDAVFPADALVREFRRYGVELPLVIVSSVPATEHAVAAIKAGALDYVPLPLECNNFANRLQRLQGEAVQMAEIYRSETEARGLLQRLSQRQIEVLAWLSEGCSNKEIARHLNISPRTVEIHRANMMNKLGAGHAAEAVRIWLSARQAEYSIGESSVASLDDARRRRAASEYRGKKWGKRALAD